MYQNRSVKKNQPRVDNTQFKKVRQRVAFQDQRDDQVSQLQAIANRSNKKTNNTGLPHQLKSGIESLSGYSMDDVKVHYNSSKPAQLNAHAYAQGTDIHVASGQEKHLAHEAWHVVQQKQGRVQPTKQLKGKVNINDDTRLEREADMMGAKALQFKALEVMNRPVKKKLKSKMIQRKISFKTGRYRNQKELINALFQIFDKKVHKEIRLLVKQYQTQKWSIYGNQVYDHIIEHFKEQGIEPSFVKTSTVNESSHGPMIPDQVNRNANADVKKSMKTFNFSSVTLGRLSMINSEEHISFQDRQVDANFHAEDGLLEQLQNYFRKNKIDTKQVRLNLTINNFFCSKTSTNKSQKNNNCLQRIIDLQKKYKFKKFHVYFQNTYGSKSEMSKSIKALQKVGIRVSSFTTNKKAPYVNDNLDPHSDSEEHEIKSEKIRTKGSSNDEREQLRLAELLGENNCLINAISRGGRGVNANMAELVQIRTELRSRGFEFGEMLVASPAILRIIRRALGINRGIRVKYKSGDSDDSIRGIRPIIIDHEGDHFEERDRSRSRDTERLKRKSEKGVKRKRPRKYSSDEEMISDGESLSDTLKSRLRSNGKGYKRKKEKED